ncbi:MAG TPA: DUF6526 family protein [Acidisarcina sp.]|nr:DUF6526 family protein [Acidisarcina sp.]
MSEKKPQTLANHGRVDPWYHFFVMPALLLNFFVCIVHEYHEPRHFDEWLIVLSIVLIVLAFRVRSYALRVQDRVIRLEERLRLAALLPEALRLQSDELTEQQLIALRFASDGELPALVEKTLRDRLAPKEIKKAIIIWRPDYWRV